MEFEPEVVMNEGSRRKFRDNKKENAKRARIRLAQNLPAHQTHHGL
jgi:hypothetical protein